MHEVIAWVWGSVRHANAMEQYTWALSVPIRTLLPEGMASGRANFLGGVHKGGAASGAASLRGGHAVLRGTQCWVVSSHSRSWTHLLLCFCVVHVRVWVLWKVELCVVSFLRQRCMLARHLSVVHTLQVWPHVLPNISGACIVLVSKTETKPRYRLLRRNYVAFVSFHWLGVGSGPWRDRRPDYELRDTEQHDRGVVSDRRRGSPDFGHLERVSTGSAHGQARPQLQPELWFPDVSTRYRADLPKGEMRPLSSRWTLQQGLPRTSPEKASAPGESVDYEREPACKSKDKDAG